ncbi:MAG: hypothetical protein HXX20_06470 [Chloroflexi bacterium]|nr:hypothetical protein [Chloroflexota bacterium]
MLDSTHQPTEPGLKPERPSKPETFGRGLFVLLLYTGLTGLITFPFGLQLGTHVIEAGGDSYQNLWYLWWYKEALLSGQDPARTHLMYGLLPSVQVLVSSVFNALWLIPFEALWGPLLAFNLGIFVSFPLAGLCLYLLAGEFTRNKLAAFVAGFLYTFSTYHLYRAEGHLGLVTVQWLPFYAWRLFVLRRNPNWPNALLAALGLALCALSDLYYLGYFVLPFTTLFLAWSLFFERKAFLKKSNLLCFGLALGLGFALILPFYAAFFQLDKDVAQAVQVRTNDASDLSADVVAFFLPNASNPLFNGLTGPIYQKFSGLFPIEQAVFPGYILLVAALVAPWLKRGRNQNTAFWVLTAGVAFVLALGPRLHVAGQDTSIPLPYSLIYGKLPFLTSFRAPNRLGVVVGMALAVLAALSLSGFFEWLQKHHPASIKMPPQSLPVLIATGLMLLATLENLVYQWPLATTEAKIPEIYRQIAAEAGDFLVMELPLAPLSAPLYYQTLHQKPLVGGYPSRISNRMSLSFDKVPYLSIFNPAESSGVMDGSAAKSSPDIFPVDLSFRQALQENNIRYVILRNYPGGRRFFTWMRPFVESNLGAAGYSNEDGSLLAWRVEPGTAPAAPSPGSYRIRVGDGWNAGLGKGEDGLLLRLVEQDAQLQVEAGSAGTANLHLKVTPYIRPQVIEVRLNGTVVGQIDGQKEWKAVEANLANLTFKAGQNLLEFHSVQGCLVASDYIPKSPDHRCISFAVQNLELKTGP